ncbi:hypothetical protein MMC29_004790 [Sticta canariensis]|nr:hypothetical protein [Sticta canariensis]
MATALAPHTVKHGQHIFFYNNIRTNQVLYSFTRTLNNNDALKQIPFLGKKTVPAKLRKDLWQPFAMVEFTNPLHGLVAYRKLREFRRLHETSYPLKVIRHKGTGPLLGTKKRGRALMDQKANSVADLAAVLLQQEQEPTAKQIQISDNRINHNNRLRKQKGDQNVWGRPVSARELSGVKGVKVRWANKLDAGFAKSWPRGVVHRNLMKNRHTAAFPAWPLHMQRRKRAGFLVPGKVARQRE